MSYVFTYRAKWSLGSDRSSFLECYMVRRRLMWRRRLTWSRRLPRRTTVRRTTVRRRMMRRRVQDRGRPAAGQLHVS
jgi:hypothetical protein